MTRTSSGLPSIAATLGKAVQRYQASVDDFDREIARLLGVGETDIRCLEILLEETEEVMPSQLATRLGLTTGSVTALLDRLERLGYLARSPHPTDRRKTIVRATEEAARRARALYDPLIEDGCRDLIPRYSTGQLELIIDFLNQATGLQQRHVQRLRDHDSTAVRAHRRTRQSS